MRFNRRQFLVGAGAAAATVPSLSTLLRSKSAAAAIGDTLTIAYHVSPPSWDPTVGPSSVNPGLQSIYKSVFDQYIEQEPNLAFSPGVLTGWGWNDDKTKVWMDVREGITWHDGKPLTPADVVWNLDRVANKDTGNVVQAVWASAGNLKVEGNRITGDVVQYVPDYFKWMAFLTAYLLPPHYYKEVGAAGFEKAPIGSGPYKVEQFEANGFLRLKRNESYWGGKPAFETVVFKFVADPSSRVAEIESGSSDLTLEIPFEEFDRLKDKEGLAGVCHPVSDVAMIFFNDVAPLEDPNVRKAMVLSVDREAIVQRLLRGYGVPLYTLEAPEYAAFDAGINVPHDPEQAIALLAKSGYSKDKPVKLTIQTTRGFRPKDYEMIQAVVGMWRKVGIEAEIEVYEIAKHFELRAQDKLAAAAFYVWGNASGDPNNSTGFAMWGPSPHSVWDTDDLDGKLAQVMWGEKDDTKRMAGWKDALRYIADNDYVLPLLQYYQPVIYKAELNFTPYVANFVLPHKTSKKA
ncbi:MAG: peptide ABC transporter substrate-binding protein [Alphaproteobacteria bacterium]|nr:peptide ABC transporter substrate-binding protein [Alphaproteobacteria bacterium]